MLTIVVPAIEEWNEAEECFIQSKEQVLQLEHSLVSISKWESKWRIPFLTDADKTFEQQIDYIRCMTITQHVDSSVYLRLTSDNMAQINKYISSDLTATTFGNTRNSRGSRQVVTSELIYYWMVALRIPFECQKWHLSRLLTLIRVCEEEQQPKKKQSRRSIAQRNAALNAARRAKLHSKG